MATVGQKGKHKGARVLRFMDPGERTKEKARAYECCSGHQTNCNKTYIDCYTPSID